MKKFIILASISVIMFITGCSSTCMEYRSATTAARSEKNLKRAEEWALKALESSECNPENDALAPYFLATEVYLKQKKYKQMAEMLILAFRSRISISDQYLEFLITAVNTCFVTNSEIIHISKSEGTTVF